MREPDEVKPHDLQELLEGRTIKSAHVHVDEDEGLGWVGITFSDGTELEISAHGMHTDGWLIFERGRRIRDIYKVPA